MEGNAEVLLKEARQVCVCDDTLVSSQEQQLSQKCGHDSAGAKLSEGAHSLAFVQLKGAERRRKRRRDTRVREASR